MRGMQGWLLLSLLVPGACSAPDPAAPPLSPPTRELPIADPSFRLELPAPVPPTDPVPGGGMPPVDAGDRPAPVAAETPEIAPGVVATSARVQRKKEASFEDVINLQKELVSLHPEREDEKLRLALLYAASGNLEEAERTMSLLRLKSNRMIPYVELYLHKALGDHQEAGRLLAGFSEEERRIAGFGIERAELVSRVRRYRDYSRAENDRVAPGGDVHLYVEPRGFAMRQTGDHHTFHLRYDWKLYDDRSVEQPVAAWEKATTEEREDRVTLNGPVAEFYQSFHLPLPLNLAAGGYRVRVIVTDVIAGKTEQADVPVHVIPVEKSR